MASKTAATIGDKRERVRIVRRVRVRDANGDYSISETLIAERWAAVAPMSGRETELAGQLRGQVDYRVHVDLYGLDVSADDIAIWTTRGALELGIREVRLSPIRAIDSELICEAGVINGPTAP